MEQSDDTMVITSAEGFTTIRIVDTSGSHPALPEVEHTADSDTARSSTSPGAVA